MIRNCETCDTEFYTRPSRVKKGWGRFCSNACRGVWYSEAMSGENSPNWRGGPIARECEVCSISFTADKSEVNKGWARYCSQECSAIGRYVAPKEYICKQCGQPFYDKDHRKTRERKFCSQRCMGEWYSENRRGELATYWKGGGKEYQCEWCGNRFEGRRNRKRRFCSPRCFAHWISKYKRGEKHHAWLGGLSFEPYGIEFNEELKEYIRDRDGHICQICGEPQNVHALSVHHIDYNKQNNDEMNLISLCRPCHSTTNANRAYWSVRLKGHVSIFYQAEQLLLGLDKANDTGTSTSQGQLWEMEKRKFRQSPGATS